MFKNIVLIVLVSFICVQSYTLYQKNKTIKDVRDRLKHSVTSVKKRHYVSYYMVYDSLQVDGIILIEPQFGVGDKPDMNIMITKDGKVNIITHEKLLDIFMGKANTPTASLKAKCEREWAKTMKCIVDRDKLYENDKMPDYSYPCWSPAGDCWNQ